MNRAACDVAPLASLVMLLHMFDLCVHDVLCLVLWRGCSLSYCME